MQRKLKIITIGDYKDSMLDYHTVEAKATNLSGETLDLTPTTFFMPTTAPEDHL